MRGLPARGPRGPGRAGRRRRGPGRRRLAGGRPQRGLPAGVQGPPPPPGRQRPPRQRQQAPRGPGRRPGGAGPGGDRGARPRHRPAAGRPVRPRRPLAGRPGRGGGPGQLPVPDQPPPGPRLRRAGRAGGGPLAAAGAEADGRRGHRRAAQRGQVHFHQPGVGGQAQDRRLPVHHPGAEPGGGPHRRHRDGPGRRARLGRRGQRGPGPRPPLPPPHRAGPGAAGDVGLGPRPGAASRRAAGGVAERAGALPARSLGPPPVGGGQPGRLGPGRHRP